jgi:nitroreductase
MDSPSDLVRPLIKTRQYREFTDEPVDKDMLTALAEVARWTGSGGNWQPWRLVMVTDVALVRRIAELGMPQTRSLRTAIVAIAISLPADPDKTVITAYDEGRLAERVLVGATMLGLGAGIAWIREPVRAAINEALGLADDRFVRTMLAIGHPTENARAYRQAPGEARLPLDELATWR